MKYSLFLSLLFLLSFTAEAQEVPSPVAGQNMQQHTTSMATETERLNQLNNQATTTTTTTRTKQYRGVWYDDKPGPFAPKAEKEAWKAARVELLASRERAKFYKEDQKLNGIMLPGDYREMKDGELLSPEAQAQLPAGNGIVERYKLYKEQQRNKPEQ